MNHSKLSCRLQGLKRLCVYLSLPTLFVLSGCVSVPKDLELTESGHSGTTHVAQIGLPSVREDFARHQNQWVRWGGTIVSVEHDQDHTVLEIISRPINGYARPVLNDRTDGRFLARVDGFLESGIYAANREITVVGELVDVIDKPIGKTNYSFPVVAVEKHRLWRKRPKYENYNHAWLHHRGHHSHGIHDDFFPHWFWHGQHSHRYESGHGSFYGHIRF